MRFFRRSNPLQNASPNFKEFYRNFISNDDLQNVIHDGLDEGIFKKLTPEELKEAERLMLENLSSDSRSAIGLGIIRSKQAVAPLRKLMAKDQKPAYAQALWRIEGDPKTVETIADAIRNSRIDNSQKIDAVRALSEIPAETSRQVLMDTLQKNTDYLLRYHSFTSLLMLYGYKWADATEHTGKVAPQIARMLNDPAASSAVLGRLAELTQGRSIGGSK
jgi:HEAT repeat protein